MEAGLDGESPRGQAAAARAVGWMIWQRPGRGRITLETDPPLIAGTPEALWSLCAQWDEIDLLLGASLDDSHRDRSPPADARRRS